MFDEISVRFEGSTIRGRRFLRLQTGKTYQTLFYGDHIRCDPVGYLRFSDTDPVMNLAAQSLVLDMVEKESIQHLRTAETSST